MQPCGECGQKFGKSPRNAYFFIIIQKRESQFKKKACQTKEESDNICLLKITYKCLRERKPLQKVLTCSEKRLFCLRLAVSALVQSLIRSWHKAVNMYERKRLSKGLFCRESQNWVFNLKKLQEMIESMSSCLSGRAFSG